ncbi:MAG: hypothetical protein AAGA48_35260 [Myxococcota bacterium]
MWIAMSSLAVAAELTVGLSYQNLQLLDQHQSPLPYAGHAPGGRLRYDSGAPVVRPFADGELGVGSSFAPSATDRGTLFVRARLEGGALGRLASIGATSLWVGGAAHARFDYIDGIAYHPWGLGQTSLDAAFRLEGPPRPWRWWVEASLPVVGSLSRHNYSLDPVDPNLADLPAFFDQGTRLVTVARAPSARARFALFHDTDKLDWMLGLRSEWLTYGLPNRLTALSWTLDAGLRFGRGGDA